MIGQVRRFISAGARRATACRCRRREGAHAAKASHAAIAAVSRSRSALAPEPRLLFLDEPTAGWARKGARRLTDLIERLRQRTTIVIIEHDMPFLFRIADRISVIQWGQVIAQGTLPSCAPIRGWTAISEPLRDAATGRHPHVLRRDAALFDVSLRSMPARSSRCLARPVPARRRRCDRSSADSARRGTIR